MTVAERDPRLPLSIHHLVYSTDNDEVTVGRPDIDSYAVLPVDGAELLRKLAEGMAPAAAAEWYRTTYGETVDINEFLDVLDEFGFLATDGDIPATAAPIRWRRLGAAVFSPYAWVVYVALGTVAVALMVRDPALAPHYRNIFFTDSLVLLQLGIFFGQMPLLLLHESFHALAGRRLGLSSSLRIGRRFYFLVFETSLDGLVTVPRRRRYLPILAGMLADGLVVATATIMAAVLRSPDGSVSAAGRVLLAFAFVTILRVAWQFYFFLRTDLYYLVTTVLGCNDLQTAALGTLRNRINRLVGRTHALVDENLWHPRDRAVARWYSWVVLGGYGFLVGTLCLAVLPAMFAMLMIVVHRVEGRPTALGLLDAAVFLVLSLGQFVFAAALAHRNRRRRPTTA